MNTDKKSVMAQYGEMIDLLVKHSTEGSDEVKAVCQEIASIMIRNPSVTVAWRYRFIDCLEGPGLWRFTDDQREIQILANSNSYEIQELYA